MQFTNQKNCHRFQCMPVSLVKSYLLTVNCFDDKPGILITNVSAIMALQDFPMKITFLVNSCNNHGGFSNDS